MRFLRRGAKKPESVLPESAVAVFVAAEVEAASFDIATGPFEARVGPRGGRVKPLASVHSQHYGDTLEHLAALFSILTGSSAAGAWAEIHRSNRGTLARFSEAFIEALAPIGPPQREGQDLLAIYQTIAEKWITAVRWSPRMQMGGLTGRIFDYSHRCRIARRRASRSGLGTDRGFPSTSWPTVLVKQRTRSTGASTANGSAARR